MYSQRGKGNGKPLQYSCLEKSMDREAWWASARGVAQSDRTEHTVVVLSVEVIYPTDPSEHSVFREHVHTVRPHRAVDN